ncbi:hypothetical protein WN943_022117 [Citrus x changshan-huyou]
MEEYKTKTHPQPQESRKTNTPDRIKVPKAFKYPESARYRSPTDSMMSPVTKGLLARHRKGPALLPPTVNHQQIQELLVQNVGLLLSENGLRFQTPVMPEDLEKPLLDPENFNREGIDLARLPLDEVFDQLRTTRQGLSSEDAEENKFLKFLSFMWNPLSWVMEAAAVMAIVLANGGGQGPDWQDFVGIVCLLLINSTISFIEENNAGNAAAALMAHLAPKTKVLREGQWKEQDAAVLVPGDIISIKLGDIIPADARLLEGDPLKIDQASVTNEGS